MTNPLVPDRLDRIVTLFAASPPQVKLDALVDYSQRLPDLPEHMGGTVMERVRECQSALFVGVEVDAGGTAHLFFDAPMEASTTRGFAGIVAAGLDGCAAAEILEVPDDFYNAMGLAEVVSPMRLRGMHAILRMVKRQIRDAQAGPT